MLVLSFDEGSSKMRSLLGGKGAELAEMTRLGLPVPPGFIVTTETCKLYFASGTKFPNGLFGEIERKLIDLEAKVNKKFGDPRRPLLVSVRSGAPVSMPGMMDTILNLGLNDETAAGLAKLSGNDRFAYDCYRRFIQMFGEIALGIDRRKFNQLLEKQKNLGDVEADGDLDTQGLLNLIQKYKELVKQQKTIAFPRDPRKQLEAAVKAVFESWNNPRAKEYRKFYKIPEDLGTAVTVQMMVFGNSGANSATGVAFTRDPSTGEKKLYVEYLANAQGEDVVAGIRTPKSAEQLRIELPIVYNELQKIAATLERHYKDMQDMEFTVENGKLYMLQTRNAKRTAHAAIQVAVDMVKEGLIDREEALLRVQPSEMEQLLHRHIDPNYKISPIARGLPASPGAATGIAVFDVEEAARLGRNNQKVILVRPETMPEDIHGIIPSQGVLTSRGGMTCHAAVVARGMGKPAVVGCEEIKIDLEAETFSVGNIMVGKGDVITIDGSSGSILLGEVPTVEPEPSPQLKELLGCADEIRDLKVRANADTPENAEKARLFGAEGIGLCRTERMFNAKNRLPIVQEMILASTQEERKKALGKLLPLQKSDFKGIFKAMHDLPVTVRLLDLPLHEFLPSVEELIVDMTTMRIKGHDTGKIKKTETILKRARELAEHNPMLGHRGCRLSIMYPEIYETQTRAIFEATVELAKEGIRFGLEIMVPLVGDANELRMLREMISTVAERTMQNAGIKIPYLLGTMIEVPRAALIAGEIAKYSDFFSFGTNDLTQMTFGYSRDDAEGKFIHDYLEKGILPYNPFESIDRFGVGKLMRMAVEDGRKTRSDLKVGICGEHGGEPNSIEFCHDLKLDYVSCSPYRIAVARLAAAQAKLKEKERIERDLPAAPTKIFL